MDSSPDKQDNEVSERKERWSREKLMLRPSGPPGLRVQVLQPHPQPLAIAITLCPSCGAPFYSQGGLRDYDPYSHIIPQVTEYDKAGC